jgi:CheY-like chemotaxis protein
MIVDDHAVIRRMVREVFEAEDLNVFDAANGAEGVQKAQEVKPSLIILDLSMPVMNGLDAAQELKVLMPHVPLLMFTNNPGWIVEKEARSAGISAVISKSDSNVLKQLLARAKALLGRDQTSAQRASRQEHLCPTAKDVNLAMLRLSKKPIAGVNPRDFFGDRMLSWSGTRMKFATALTAQRLFKLPLAESCSGHLCVVRSMIRTTP